jgi:hypothetical protein
MQSHIYLFIILQQLRAIWAGYDHPFFKNISNIALIILPAD